MAVELSCVVYTFLHEMRMRCSLVWHTCPLHVECTGCWNVRVLCTLTSCRAYCCVVLLCLSTEVFGCSLGAGWAGGVCICCCGLRSWYILVLHIGVHHHDDCRGLNHRSVLLSHSPNGCNVCYHACHTCLSLWLRWCTLVPNMQRLHCVYSRRRKVVAPQC